MHCEHTDSASQGLGILRAEHGSAPTEAMSFVYEEEPRGGEYKWINIDLVGDFPVGSVTKIHFQLHL